jgi:hypothetical protein
MTVQLKLKDDELGLAIAALTAIVVKTMNGQDDTFVERFTKNLSIMYKKYEIKRFPKSGHWKC